MVITYKKWKRYNEIQLTKNKMDLNIWKMTNHPPSPECHENSPEHLPSGVSGMKYGLFDLSQHSMKTGNSSTNLVDKTSFYWLNDKTSFSRCSDKGKVFYGQEPPSGESTTTECGVVNYQLLAVIYWSSPPCLCSHTLFLSGRVPLKGPLKHAT